MMNPFESKPPAATFLTVTPGGKAIPAAIPLHETCPLDNMRLNVTVSPCRTETLSSTRLVSEGVGVGVKVGEGVRIGVSVASGIGSASGVNGAFSSGRALLPACSDNDAAAGV